MMKNIIMDAIISLVQGQVDFVICGGVACVLHGSHRVTMDLDIALDLEKVNLEHFITSMKSSGFKPRIPEPFENLLDPQKREFWLKEKNALVYTVYSDSGLQIDVFLSYPLTYAELKQGSAVFEIDGFQFNVSSVNDLISAKMAVKPPRNKDIEDIEILKEIKSDKQK